MRPDEGTAFRTLEPRDSIGVSGLAFSADSKLLAVGGALLGASVFRISDGTVVPKLPALGAYPAFSVK